MNENQIITMMDGGCKKQKQWLVMIFCATWVVVVNDKILRVNREKYQHENSNLTLQERQLN